MLCVGPRRVNVCCCTDVVLILKEHRGGRLISYGEIVSYNFHLVVKGSRSRMGTLGTVHTEPR